MFNTTSERHNEFVGPIRIDPSPGEQTGEITTGPAGPVAFRTRSTGSPGKTSEGADRIRMTDKESPLADIYTLLGVSQMSPMEGVRTQFYKLTRLIHRELAVSTDIDRRNKLLYDLKFICIAYDILSDPVTRTDYDLRTMGLRGVSMPQTPDEKKPGELGQRLHLKIGELLNVAGLLEASELEIACDMHKAMPEMQFGSFLVKQGFIEEYQLEAVLFAQKLLRKGLITVVQYQAAMEELESSGVGVSETVVERGYVTQSDLDHLEEVEAEAEAELNRPTEAPVYTQPPLQPKADEQVTSHSNLLAQMLPPGSPDVVSARSSGNGEKPAPSMLHKLLSGAQDGDVTAPPATMKDLLKAGAQAAQAAQAEVKEPKEGKEHKESKEVKEHKEHKEQKEQKEHKEPKEGGRKKKNTHEEVPVDPNLGLGLDVASDTYEGVGYKDDLLKPVDAGPALWTVTQEAAMPSEDNFIAEGDGAISADDGDNTVNYGEIMAPSEADSAPSDELGLVDAETSGTEFQGFVDEDENADDEDQDDEEDEDEGNITLIDADGAQLVEAAFPQAEANQDAQLGGAREKTDATHERIPAYAWSERSLTENDISNSAQSPQAETAQEPVESEAKRASNAKKEQSTTRDKIPAFRPPLHSTFQLDADAAQQPDETAQEEEGGEAAERQLVISNAVPSNYQLDWSVPEDEEQARQQSQPPQAPTASQESEPIVDISRHLDLEAIEPPQKSDSDDELNSFLGEEYREDLNEQNESGKPLWDVEDDEFIVPSQQKRQQQLQLQQQQQQAQLDDSEAGGSKERRVSGGWQRLKNPFELNLDTQQSSSSASGQVTGEEAVVEVPEEEALETSRSATADIDRKSLAAYAQSAEPEDASHSSSDSADSFVEAHDAIEEEPHQAAPQATSRPHIVIALEDADEVEEAPAAHQTTAEEQPIEIPIEAEELEEAQEEESAAEAPSTDQIQISAEENETDHEVAQPVAEDPAQEVQIEVFAPAPSNAEEESKDEDVQPASSESEETAAPAEQPQENSAQDEESGDAESDDDEDGTASDDKAAASAQETPLARRRRMLGRRHHRGKP